MRFPTRCVLDALRHTRASWLAAVYYPMTWAELLRNEATPVTVGQLQGIVKQNQELRNRVARLERAVRDAAHLGDPTCRALATDLGLIQDTRGTSWD